MLVVFVANLARPALVEADALAATLGIGSYETRLALAAGPPAVLLTTTERERAEDVVGMLRSRGHGAHIFDDANFVTCEQMIKLDSFRLDADGVRRTATGDLLPYGDVFAILRAVHDANAETEHDARTSIDEKMMTRSSLRVTTKKEDREHVVYFFRRSGEKPWLLRERHTSYVGLGEERGPVAFGNFAATLTRVRNASPMAIFDDRLVRRRVAERANIEAVKSSRNAMDLLAHLLAMTIASQGGSPYR